jgi:glutamate-1-semialdehyde aminotransferase
MLASRVMMEHLVAQEKEVYPRIAALGEMARRTVEEAFRSAGIFARCTGGASDALPAGSMGAAHFPHDRGSACDTPEETRNPSVCDVELADRVVQLALLLEDVFVMHGLGSVSAAHTEADIARLGDACVRAARRIAPHL